MHKIIFKVVGAAALSMVLGFSIAQARDFKIVGNADQTLQIEQSLAVCPSLDTKFNSLVKSAGFQQIRVTTPDETKRVGPFLAAISGNEIIVTADWLAQQSVPYFDVRHAGEILPDNLCFDLGHLSDHVAHPEALTPRGLANMQTWLTERLKAESRACIRGWPFVLEAARVKNGERPLTGAQIGNLIINLRYRFAFVQAIAATANPKLVILPNGDIPETDANIAAIGAVLSHSSVADLE